MSGKNYQVKELARLAKVTVRTLHHYDNIGLLEPSGRTRAGYRLYEDKDLLRLQQILICRELGMPLEQIRRTLDDPTFDQKAALLHQRDQLVQQARETQAMIRSVEAALATIRGDIEMNAENLYDGFDPEEHKDEAQKRWGETDAYRESARRTKKYTPKDWEGIRAADQANVRELATKLAEGTSPEDDEVLELAEQHRLHIDRWFYPCSHSMHAQLAELYVSDSKFTAAYDQHGEGLAAFIAAAIRANTAKNT